MASSGKEREGDSRLQNAFDDDSPEKLKRNNTMFKKWAQDDDREEIERILQLKKEESNDDLFHEKLR